MNSKRYTLAGKSRGTLELLLDLEKNKEKEQKISV